MRERRPTIIDKAENQIIKFVSDVLKEEDIMEVFFILFLAALIPATLTVIVFTYTKLPILNIPVFGFSYFWTLAVFSSSFNKK